MKFTVKRMSKSSKGADKIKKVFFKHANSTLLSLHANVWISQNVNFLWGFQALYEIWADQQNEKENGHRIDQRSGKT